MYSYYFNADFVCGLPGNASITTAIRNAVARYNGVLRKVYKHLAVTINNNGGLTYHLTSSIPINYENLLRSCQFFSKKLAQDPAMSAYVRLNRMMKR